MKHPIKFFLVKKRTTVIGLIVLTGGMRANTQDTVQYLSLRQSCQLALEKNVNVQNAELEKQKTHFQFKEAQSKLYPQVEGYSSFNYYYAIPKMVIPGEIFGQTGPIPVEIGTKFDWSSGFKASQVLYNQSYFTSLKLAKQMEILNILSLRQQREAIVYQVSQLYFLCQNTLKQAELLSGTLSNSERLLEIAKLQSENGIIRKVDYSRVQVNKSNIQTQIDNLNQLYAQQLGLLKYLIGLDTGNKIILSDTMIVKPVISIYEEIDFSKRPEILLLDRQLEINSLLRKGNREAYLPSLSGFGQYYYQGQRNEFDFFKGGNDKFFKVGVVGINLSVPIFNGFEKHAKTMQSDIEQMQLENTRSSTKSFLSKEYTDAIRQYKSSLAAIERQQKNIEVAEETYNISLQEYQQQVISLSDLLLSESSLTEARLSYFNALLQLENAGLELKKAKGELLNF